MKDVLHKIARFIKDLFSFKSHHEQKRLEAMALLKQFNEKHPSDAAMSGKPHKEK